MSNPSPSDSRAPTVDVGNRVFDSEGDPLGVVREQTAALSSRWAPTTPGATGRRAASSAMWRCMECGEMGNIESLPEECPSCAASRESIYYRTED